MENRSLKLSADEEEEAKGRVRMKRAGDSRRKTRSNRTQERRKEEEVP